MEAKKNHKNFHPAGDCPIRSVLSRLGDKWSMLVMVTLYANDMLRFGDIQKTIGDISQRMLTVTLRSLEADGLVSRRIYPEIPPRVEYRLTERGESLLPHIRALVDWAEENKRDILSERNEPIGKER
jgi:DNA-binding HxlR family transcriptional regulator